LQKTSFQKLLLGLPGKWLNYSDDGKFYEGTTERIPYKSGEHVKQPEKNFFNYELKRVRK